MIALIDYGAGNLRSVHKALRYLDAEVRLATNAKGLDAASAVVLPGVGAFDDCIQSLERRGLLAACKDFIRSGRPFLGICVGYQALFEGSDEFHSCAAGLSVFEGKVVRFADRPGLKIPQIGWNEVEITQPSCPILRGIPDRSHFYFVHSFYPCPTDTSIIAGRTMYGDSFASMIWKDRVFATQFHPEKSQKRGLHLLKNFVALASSRNGA